MKLSVCVALLLVAMVTVAIAQEPCENRVIDVDSLPYEFSSQSCLGASPQYPDDVTWTLTFNLASGLTSFSVDYEIDIEPGYDNLYIGPNSAGIFGRNESGTVEVTSGPLLPVRFTSDYTVTGRGFNLTFSAEPCENRVIDVDSLPYEFSSQSCLGASPQYPDNVSWTLTFNLASGLTSFSVDYEIDIEPWYDYLNIGPNNAGIFGRNVSGTVEATGPQLTVIFWSDSSVTGRGFLLRFYNE